MRKLLQVFVRRLTSRRRLRRRSEMRIRLLRHKVDVLRLREACMREEIEKLWDVVKRDRHRVAQETRALSQLPETVRMRGHA